jgi:hypothetical protein
MSEYHTSISAIAALLTVNVLDSQRPTIDLYENIESKPNTGTGTCKGLRNESVEGLKTASSLSRKIWVGG